MKILVALGSSAILQHKEQGTSEEQFENVRWSCKQLVRLLLDGHQIAITHGDGSQVGDILLKNELAKSTLPAMPFDVCGEESQDMIGYMMQQVFFDEMKAAGLEMPVVTVLTQTVVNPNDPAFQSPSKPVDPFYTAMETSKLRNEEGWKIVNDSGRGFRRVVPSPNPFSIIESPVIKRLFEDGTIVISSGGGASYTRNLGREGSPRGRRCNRQGPVCCPAHLEHWGGHPANPRGCREGHAELRQAERKEAR